MKKIITLLIVLCSFASNAQVVYIPDPILKNALLNYSPEIDTNGNNQIEVSEALLVTALTIPQGGPTPDDYIMSFTGLEAFTNLIYLDCSNNGQDFTLNVAPFVNLQTLICNNNNSATITGLEALINLVHLECTHTKVPGIVNVATLPNLQYIDCSWKTYSGVLNVSGLANLTYLNCARMQLTSLSVTGTHLSTLICDVNNLTSLNLSSQPNLTELNCSSNANLAITPALGTFTTLEHLNCSATGLSALNLTALSNLKTLQCSGNNLSTLNFSNLHDLTDLIFWSNNISTIDFSPLTSIVNLSCGGNSFTTLNVSSLPTLKTFTCADGQLSGITFNQVGNLESVNLGGNQLTSIDFGPLVHVKILNCAFNQLSSIDISSLSELEGINCQNNLLTDLDISNNLALTEVTCKNNLFTTLDFSDFAGTSLSCSVGGPLLEYVNVKCGKPVSVSINEFDGPVPDLLYICADEANVNAIRSDLGFLAYDIQVNSYCSFTPGGSYDTLNGNISVDLDGNGCDASDPHLEGIKLNMSNGISNNSMFSGPSGDYAFYAQSGELTITPATIPFFTFSPASATINLNVSANTVHTQNFCLMPNGIHKDLEATIIPVLPARPGFDAAYQLIYKNKGTQTMSGTVNLTYNDNVLDLVTSNPTTSNQSGGYLEWDFTNLRPFERHFINFTLNVNSPLETPAVNNGDHLLFTTTITPVAEDETIEDNTDALDQIVVGSFDPNDKTCLEGTTMLPQMVGDYLHYVIRFQNSGTFPAENVVVKDVIDTTKFDINTLQLTSSSHPNVTRITGNVVEFIHQDINLPAEETDEPGSHGYVAFKIKTKNNLILGNSVTNIADIFFDFNFPITTNEATTTVSMLGLNQFENISVSVSPNPVKNVLHISAKDNITSIQLFDIQGRLLQTKLENNNNSSLNLSGKTNGIYFVKVVTDKGMKVEKIIKE
jgi:hypothetical protein